MLFEFVGGEENEQPADGVNIDPREEIPALHIPFLHGAIEIIKDRFIHPAENSRDDYEQENNAEFLVVLEF